MKTKKKKVLIGKEGRRCQKEECGKILSIYNLGKYCFNCQATLITDRLYPDDE